MVFNVLCLFQANDWKIILLAALNDLAALLHDERVVSAYELYSSGVVQALLKLLGKNVRILVYHISFKLK